jgi:hypothetical protein
MNHIFTLTTEIPPSREVLLQLPEDFPLGCAEISIQTHSQAKEEMHTLGDFLASEFCGMWRNRDDIRDSVEFAGDLRVDAWRKYDRSLP